MVRVQMIKRNNNKYSQKQKQLNMNTLKLIEIKLNTDKYIKYK